MIIFRYLAKEVVTALLAATLILLLIFLSNEFIRYMNSAAAGHLTAHLVLLLLVLRIPLLLALLLPLSLYLGILLSYGRMYADNEMTVLFASGVSRAKIIKMTFKIALFVALISGILMLWVAPKVNKYTETLISKGAFSPLELVTPGGFQALQGGNWVFYVREVSKKHKKLHNIFAVQHNKHGYGVLTAESAHQQYNKKTGDTFLVLNNGHRYLGIPGERNYQLVDFDQYGMRISQDHNYGKEKSSSMSTLELWKKRAQNSAAAELQWRLAVPIMTIILMLLAVPLSRVKTRQGRYAQLAPAILLYMAYGNFIFLGRSWLRDGFVPHYIGMWWIHLIMLSLALLLITQQKLRK